MKYSKILTFFLIFIMVLSLTGCRKAEEKIVESITGSKVGIKDDGLKLEAEDTAMETGNDLEWPAEAMGDLLVPEARVDFIMKNDEFKSCTVTLKDFEEKEGRAYLEKLIEMGFKDGADIQTNDMIMFSGRREDGSGVQYTYYPEEKEGLLIFEGKK